MLAIGIRVPQLKRIHNKQLAAQTTVWNAIHKLAFRRHAELTAAPLLTACYDRVVTAHTSSCIHIKTISRTRAVLSVIQTALVLGN
jgi:hypothetical protein